MSRLDEIQAALADLGDGVDQVAANLDALGCRGPRKSANACPVWVYLDGRLNHIVDSVESDHIWYFTDDGPLDYMDTPDEVGEFIERFDEGEFPALDETAGAVS